MREQLDVKDDAEWKVLSGAIGKVMDAQQEVMAGRFRGMMGGRRNRDAGNGGDQGGGNGGNGGDQGGQRRRGGPGGFGTPSPEAEALQKAIEAKATEIAGQGNVMNQLTVAPPKS